MKKILVTGSEGYIGTVMMPNLIRAGYKVVGLDCCFFSQGNLNGTSFVKYPFIKKDIRDVKESDLKGFDTVIHLAALSNDPLGMLSEQLTYDINCEASVKLAELSKKAGVERFLFSSSCSLYGSGERKLLTENAPARPQTAYGKSKIHAEKEIKELADNKFSPVFMRNATVFGFSPRMRFDLVVNNLVGYAQTKNEIRILGDGKPWRPLIHIQDVCHAFIKALRANKHNIHNQIFNVGDCNENYQIKTIAKKIQHHYPDCQISIAQKDARDNRDYNVSFEKIREKLNFNIAWDLAKGIAELKSLYNQANLDSRIFEFRLYTRLKQINYLLEKGFIDKNLRGIKL